MKNLIDTNFQTDDLLLTACIWFAHIDITGLADYALKAFIGGVIWFGFKVAADYYGGKFRNKKNKDL